MPASPKVHLEFGGMPGLPLKPAPESFTKSSTTSGSRAKPGALMSSYTEGCGDGDLSQTTAPAALLLPGPPSAPKTRPEGQIGCTKAGASLTMGRGWEGGCNVETEKPAVFPQQAALMLRAQLPSIRAPGDRWAGGCGQASQWVMTLPMYAWHLSHWTRPHLGN